MSGRNIVLTGIPRSGTTLTCHLLNKLPQFVALHEPMSPLDYAGLDTEDVIHQVRRFFADQRESILQTGKATSKSVQGAVPDNFIGEIDEKTGARKVTPQGRVIRVDKPLSPDFSLAVKHPGFFTALLGELVKHFDCYAIVRNPLSVLMSWNTVDMMAVASGFMPAGEAFDAALAARLHGEDDVSECQLTLLSWFYGNYKRFLPPDRVIRYEAVVSSGGKALVPVSTAAVQLDEPLVSKNKSHLYDHGKKHVLADKLLKSDGHHWDFYDKSQLEELL